MHPKPPPHPTPLDGQGQTSVQEMRLYSLRPVRLPWGPGRPVVMEGEVGRDIEGGAPSLGLPPGDCAQGVWVCHWSLSARVCEPEYLVLVSLGADLAVFLPQSLAGSLV